MKPATKQAVSGLKPPTYEKTQRARIKSHARNIMRKDVGRWLQPRLEARNEASRVGGKATDLREDAASKHQIACQHHHEKRCRSVDSAPT